jgi:hypothetical protein
MLQFYFEEYQCAQPVLAGLGYTWYNAKYGGEKDRDLLEF